MGFANLVGVPLFCFFCFALRFSLFVSITDGQLYLDAVLFGVGTCPAVSVERSVSRVGAKSLDQL